MRFQNYQPSEQAENPNTNQTASLLQADFHQLTRTESPTRSTSPSTAHLELSNIWQPGVLPMTQASYTEHHHYHHRYHHSSESAYHAEQHRRDEEFYRPEHHRQYHPAHHHVPYHSQHHYYSQHHQYESHKYLSTQSHSDAPASQIARQLSAADLASDQLPKTMLSRAAYTDQSPIRFGAMLSHSQDRYGFNTPFQHGGFGSAPMTRLDIGDHLKMARYADKTANAIDTVGNCALGPRKVFEHYGLMLPAVVATEQGAILQGMVKDGLFTEVSRRDVRPGDYGYRHWTAGVVRAHGIDKGDAFFVSSVGRHGELIGANDHRFVVPGDGGRYTNTRFLRPTPEFFARYGGNASA